MASVRRSPWTTAALRYQHATDERDRKLATGVDGLIQAAREEPTGSILPLRSADGAAAPRRDDAMAPAVDDFPEAASPRIAPCPSLSSPSDPLFGRSRSMMIVSRMPCRSSALRNSPPEEVTDEEWDAFHAAIADA